MPVYIYETIPASPKQRPRRFEMHQRMSEKPLKKDPKTGLPVKRIITGGIEIPRGRNIQESTNCGCGRPCGCCG